jgi:DNA-directed RNA polymerase subunit RPC12/RpoP
MNACIFRCLRCKKSLQRFRPMNVLRGLSSERAEYLCPHCSRRYNTPFFISIFHKLVVCFLSIVAIIFFFPDDGDANLFYVVFIAVFITYAIGSLSLLKPVSLNRKE